MSPEMKNLMDTAERFARARFAREGDLMPMWDLVTAEGDHVLLPTPWRDDEEKDAYMAVLRILANGTSPRFVRYVFVCEAWKVELAQGDVDDGTAPSEHPARREVAQVSGGERGDPYEHLGTMDIIRAPGAEPALGGMRVDSCLAHGCIIGLFDDGARQ